MHMLPTKFLNSLIRKEYTERERGLMSPFQICHSFGFQNWCNSSKRSTHLCYILQLRVIWLWPSVVLQSILNTFFLENNIVFSFFYKNHQGLEEFENKIEKISSGQDDNSWLGQLYRQVSWYKWYHKEVLCFKKLVKTELVSTEKITWSYFQILFYTTNSLRDSKETISLTDEHIIAGQP